MCGIIDSNSAIVEYINSESTEFISQVMPLQKKPIEIKRKPTKVSKGRFSTFMEKEIFEIPEVVERIKVAYKNGRARLAPTRDYENLIKSARTIHIAACGTSYHAGLFIGNLLEQKGKRSKVYIASELSSINPHIADGDVGLVITQSGETADTLGALDFMKRASMFTLGICNVEGSSVSRYVDRCLLTHAGTEVAVASTKAFVAQVLVGMKLCGVSVDFDAITAEIHAILQRADEVKAIAKKHREIKKIFFLGRGFNAIVAIESALKVKETTYLHCEGFPSNEFRHGPLSMVDRDTLCVTFGEGEKIDSITAEVSSRGSHIWSVKAEHPLGHAVYAQLFALYMAQELGLDADKPRNLAKSVMVE